MPLVAYAARRAPNGTLNARLLADAGVENPRSVLRLINEGASSTHTECIRYSECLGYYVRYHGDASDVPARCPSGCLFYERAPRHALHAIASARTESQWSMTAMPEQGWDRKHDNEDEPEAAE